MVWIRAMQFSKTRRHALAGAKKEWQYSTTPRLRSRTLKALKTEQQLLDRAEDQPSAYRPVEVS
jgi:hypothetical protein